MVRLGEKPGYKKTKLGWIPEEWEPIHVGRLVKQLSAGKSVNSHDEPAVNGEPAILKTSCVFGGQFDILQNKRIVDSEVDLACVNPIEGRLIISRMNTPDLVGAVGYVDQGSNSVFLPDRLWQTEFYNEKEFSSRWLYYYLNTPIIKSKIKSLATGTSGSMKNLSKGSLLALKLPLPPLPEQRAIAAVLATWDSAIDLTRRLIETKKARQKGLMQQLLSGKKRLDGFEGEWIRVKAGEIFESVSKKGFEDEELLSVTQDYGVIPRSSLEARVTMPSGNTKSFKLVEPGNFVISLRSFQGGLEFSKYRGVVSPAYTVLKPSTEIDDSFYRHYFKSYDFIGHLAVAVIGIRDGKQISYQDFCIVKIPFPTIEEQRAIAAVLSRGEAEIKQSEQYLATLQQQKKGLMQKLLTGEVRLKKLQQ